MGMTLKSTANYLSFCFSWFANANLAAFSCNFANLFSYFETFLSVGLMNFPFMSLTDMFNSLIWRSRRMTSLCKKNISPSKLYHLSKYSLTIFFSTTSFRNDTLAFRCLSFLLFLELLSCLFSEQGTQFLLPLWGHKSLLLCHFCWFCVVC